MKEDNKISIIIPVYNCEKYLNRCLDSLINQTYKNIEIILVDDGSSDLSSKICNEYALKDSRIFVYSQNNQGPSSARNLGIEKATGDYVFFCDSDDYIDFDTIKCLIDNKSDDLVGVKHKNIYKNKVELISYNNCYKKEDFVKDIVNGKVLGTIWGYIFDKEKIKNLQFDNNTMCMEDAIFLIKYLQENNIKNIKFVDGSCYNYVLNDNSITTAKNKDIEKCILKYKNYEYSLSKIDDITEKKYSANLNDNKVEILENYMCQIPIKNKNYELFIKKFNIQMYSKKSIRFKFFSKNYRNKNYIGLKVYFISIKFLKSVRRFLHGRN